MRAALIALSLGAAIYSAACLRGNMAGAQQPAPTPETPAQLFQDKCSACHNAPDPDAEGLSVAGWKNTVNRMLYQHGASGSISPDQAATILAYLDTFAVTPTPGGRAGRPRTGNATDVWAGDPIYSHVYIFSTAAAVDGLQTLAGHDAFRAANPLSDKQLIVAAYGSATGLFKEALPPQSGKARDLQMEADFQQAPPPPGEKTGAPVSFGLAFDIMSPRNYCVVAYSESEHLLTLTKYVNGSASPTVDIPMASALAPTPDGWHHMKVSVVGGKVKVWLDYTKCAPSFTADPGGAGDVGLWSGTRAVVKNLIVDVYDGQAAAQSPSVD